MSCLGSSIHIFFKIDILGGIFRFTAKLRGNTGFPNTPCAPTHAHPPQYLFIIITMCVCVVFLGKFLIQR